MRDRSYFMELRILPEDEIFGASREARVMPVHVAWAGSVVKILHGFAAKREEGFSLAFPGWRAGEFRKIGDVIRVFGSREFLESAKRELAGKDWVARTTLASAVERSPEKPLAFVSFSREQSPRRGKMSPEAFSKRMAKLSSLPTLGLSSASTGSSHFFLAIDRSVHKQDLGAAETNGYGLSTSSKTCCLPDFPPKSSLGMGRLA